MLINSGEVKIGASLQSTPTEPLALIPGRFYASAGQINVVDQTLTWSGEIIPRGMVIVRFAAALPKDAALGTIVHEATLTDDGGIVTALEAVVVVSDEYRLYFPLIYPN